MFAFSIENHFLNLCVDNPLNQLKDVEYKSLEVTTRPQLTDKKNHKILFNTKSSSIGGLE